MVKKAAEKFKAGAQRRREDGSYALGGKKDGGTKGTKGRKYAAPAGKQTNAAALIYGKGGNDDDSSDG